MKSHELFIISLTVFLTIVAWMLLDFYKINKTVDVQTALGVVTEIDFTIDPHTLDVLEKKTL
ncbi:hypothetical protein HY214_02655 [Candidatus Roizmanbacteria bacterium]|nr:hypothetical protein [Candidatus Roizmanbacteria bacterium]